MKIYGEDFAIVHAMGVRCTCNPATDWDGNHDEHCNQVRVLTIAGALVARMAKLATEQERERVCGIVAEYSDGPSGGRSWAANVDDIKAAIVAKIREG